MRRDVRGHRRVDLAGELDEASVVVERLEDPGQVVGIDGDAPKFYKFSRHEYWSSAIRVQHAVKLIITVIPLY